ncbi:adhesion G protein-coupled receptor A3, partial [Aplysia californica]|uniref:Adhesion G protein-coupled receptor A3 n=1 Tax=Aplysia californica TaxID=6500 RepID=A0ABM1A2F9_APLCA
MAASDQRRHPLFLLFFVLSVLLSVCNCCIQLPSCNCTMVGSSKRQRGRKIDCSQHPAPFKTLVGKSFPPDTVHLNLAHNALVALRQGSFIHFSSLQKLNLSSNQITIIEPGAFDGLKSLKKLDLSNNLIGTINSSMFSGLPNLEKLFFSNNRISTIPDGTFNYLPSLKRIELQSNYLRCDCHLKWILKWIKTRHVRIPSSTTCALPAKMRNKPLSKLKRRDLHCDHSVQLLTFNIRPSESQLVFKGDKLPFECHASYMPGDMSIAWFRSGHLVTTNKTMGVFVHTSHNLDRTIIIHRLVVESLDTTHAGEWSCVVSTSSGNLTKTVHVEVRMPDVVLQCPTVTNKTSKGMFTWEESISGLLGSQLRGEAADLCALGT